MVRALVIAPAQMQPHGLGRNIGHRMVERLDVEPHLVAEFGESEPGILDVPAHREVGAVELQDETGVDDSLVFRPHRLGDRREIALFARIMAVMEEQRDETRRGCSQKALRRDDARHRRLQIVGVDLGGARFLQCNRAVAAGGLAPGAAGIAEHAPRQFGEIDEILVGERMALAAKARKPVLDVGRVARLRDLAVIDDIDPGRGLLLDDFGDGSPDARGERRGIDRHSFLFREHHAHKIFRARQTAGVCRQKPLAAAFHRGSFENSGSGL